MRTDVSIMRSSQLDAARLDNELTGMLREQFMRVFALFQPVGGGESGCRRAARLPLAALCICTSGSGFHACALRAALLLLLAPGGCVLRCTCWLPALQGVIASLQAELALLLDLLVRRRMSRRAASSACLLALEYNLAPGSTPPTAHTQCQPNPGPPAAPPSRSSGSPFARASRRPAWP